MTNKTDPGEILICLAAHYAGGPNGTSYFYREGERVRRDEIENLIDSFWAPDGSPSRVIRERQAALS